jgi:hypothetical protein
LAAPSIDDILPKGSIIKLHRNTDHGEETQEKEAKPTANVALVIPNCGKYVQNFCRANGRWKFRQSFSQ